MGDEKRSDSEKEQKSGFPKIRAMHVVIAVAVIVLAVIFIAKFRFGMDLISPSSGEMAVVKRPDIAPVRTIPPDIKRPERTLMPVTTVTTTPLGAITTTIPVTTTLPVTTTTTTPVAATTTWPCTDTATDPHNCGACGNDCYQKNNVDEVGCVAGKCAITSCKSGYWNCYGAGKTDLNGDGCESNLLTGKVDSPGWTNTYVCQMRNKYTPGPYVAGAMNCGYCGNQCRGGGSESYGLCVGNSCQNVCQEPWLNCDNSWSNGCEQAYDDNNCGSCGAKCPSDAHCNNGCCIRGIDQRKVTDSHGWLCSAEDTEWEKGWSEC
jgi:hypothetical protein